MEISYSLSEENYLNHQLFHASESMIIRKRRFRSKYIFPLVYLLLGIFLYAVKSPVLGYIFGGLGIVWFFLYPFYETGAYVKQYKKLIKENFSESINKTVNLTLDDTHLRLVEGVSEAKIDYSEIKQIAEIPHEILIKISNGNTIIIPKNQISNLESVAKKLEEIADKLQIDYLDYSQWRWK